jgi:general secretion pathway protein M
MSSLHPKSTLASANTSAGSQQRPAWLGQWQNTWQSSWRQRSPREQQLLLVGSLVLTGAAIWSLALAPALRTWQEAPAKQAQLDEQSQRMRQLQAQAQSLQKPQTLSRAEASQWLEKNLSDLGPNAQIQLQDDRATLRLQAAPADALARWLRQARENAQALPLQADMQGAETALPNRPALAPAASAPVKPMASAGQIASTAQIQPQAPNTATPPQTQGEALWRGSIVLRLP